MTRPCASSTAARASSFTRASTIPPLPIVLVQRGDAYDGPRAAGELHGRVQIIEHDGSGHVEIHERRFVIQNRGASLDLDGLRAPGTGLAP